MNIGVCSKLDDIKEKFASEHNEVKPSEAIKEVLEILQKEVLNVDTILGVKNNIYSTLKERVETYSKKGYLKPIDNIVIEELISTIYGGKVIDYTMYNFLQPEAIVSLSGSKNPTKVNYPKVSEMYSLEKELHTICGKIGIVGLIEYTKLLNRYGKEI